MDINPNQMQIDEEQMDDEQFLAHQMYLAGLENRSVQIHGQAAHQGGHQVIQQAVNNQAAPQLVNNQVGQQAGNNQDGQQAANNQIAQQNGDQVAQQAGNQVAQKVGDQVAQHAGGQMGQQAGGQVGQQAGGQARNLGGHVGNNVMAGGHQQILNWHNLELGNHLQYNQNGGRGVLHGYPRGHLIYGYQGLGNQNLRNPVGLGHQKLLSPVEISRANRLKTIIDNLEFELERNRQVYRTFYGNIPGEGRHDAGYWKKRFYQEKNKKSNGGRNLFFFRK